MNQIVLAGREWSPDNLSDDSILDVSCSVSGDLLEMTWGFRRDLLERESVEKITRHYAECLKEMMGALVGGELRLRLPGGLGAEARFAKEVEGLWRHHQEHVDIGGDQAGGKIYLFDIIVFL